MRGQKVADGVEFYIAAASREVQEAAEKSGAWKALVDAGARPLSVRLRALHRARHRPARGRRSRNQRTNRNFKGRMGAARRAATWQPQVVAASALAGYIRGPKPMAASGWNDTGNAGASRAGAGAGGDPSRFPERIAGRLVFLPQDNLNTTGSTARTTPT